MSRNSLVSGIISGGWLRCRTDSKSYRLCVSSLQIVSEPNRIMSEPNRSCQISNFMDPQHNDSATRQRYEPRNPTRYLAPALALPSILYIPSVRRCGSIESDI